MIKKKKVISRMHIRACRRAAVPSICRGPFINYVTQKGGGGGGLNNCDGL